MDFSKYKAVIFDLDNTLYSPNHLGRRLVTSDLPNMFKARRDRVARKNLKGKDFNNSQAFYEAFFDMIGKNSREWYFNKYLPLMVKILKKKFKARPKAQELIDRLESEGIKVCVYSDYPMVRERCEAIGLRFNNSQLWCSEMFGALKPAVRPFTSIAEKLGLMPNEVLYIGDRPDTDYAGATAAGMDCILVKTDSNKNEQSVLEWDEIVKDI